MVLVSTLVLINHQKQYYKYKKFKVLTFLIIRIFSKFCVNEDNVEGDLVNN